MPTQIPYDRSKAAAYAEKWAFSRNPRYISFDGMGGDCTSFVSQCLYAGTGVMNYTRDTGWYYNSASDRAAAWSGVPYLYRFLTGNRSVGPTAGRRRSRSWSGEISSSSATRRTNGITPSL